jgi:hypothetical protein
MDYDELEKILYSNLGVALKEFEKGILTMDVVVRLASDIKYELDNYPLEGYIESEDSIAKHENDQTKGE